MAMGVVDRATVYTHRSERRASVISLKLRGEPRAESAARLSRGTAVRHRLRISGSSHISVTRHQATRRRHSRKATLQRASCARAFLTAPRPPRACCRGTRLPRWGERRPHARSGAGGGGGGSPAQLAAHGFAGRRSPPRTSHRGAQSSPPRDRRRRTPGRRQRRGRSGRPRAGWMSSVSRTRAGDVRCSRRGASR